MGTNSNAVKNAAREMLNISIEVCKSNRFGWVFVVQNSQKVRNRSEVFSVGFY